MSFDLLIKNGTVVDGTGSPRRHADVAVSGGKIVEIGKISAAARRTIDADGRIVAPGFVDPHTHYDAQICWDTAVTPSPWHGVTTTVMGNCGVGIAPCKPEGRQTAIHDLVNVEGMPFDVLNSGITWEWETFPEFMDAAERRRSAVNLPFIAPLTPFRYYVMGDPAIDRAATADERTKIAGLLDAAMSAGAFGFSTTQLQNHIGYLGRPLACRNADRAELGAYANVLAKHGKGIIEIALTQQTSVVSDHDYAMLDLLSTQSGRPVTWLSLVSREDIPAACDASLEKVKPLLARRAYPQICARPMTRDLDLKTPHSFMGFPSWHRVVNKPVEEQMRILGDPAFRNLFRDEMKKPGQFTGNWSLFAVAEVFNPALKRHEGKTIEAIARERGTDGVDALLDLAIEDGLRTEFSVAFLNTNDKAVAKLLQNPQTLIGLSDGGAHLGVLCDAGYCTYLLGKWVRELQVLTLEHAVQRMTSEPAQYMGIADRGILHPGLAADITIFDADTVGSDDRGQKRYDLPGNAKRIVMPSRGIDFTIVNGEVLYEQNSLTGALSGRVLRS